MNYDYGMTGRWFVIILLIWFLCAIWPKKVKK